MVWLDFPVKLNSMLCVANWLKDKEGRETGPRAGLLAVFCTSNEGLN